jgi:two-component system, NtrC family, sensor histidine kinase AtoS
MQLMVLLPLTMGLLVAATGFFALSMSRRIHVLHGLFGMETERQLRTLDVQVLLIAAIAAVLAFAIAFGIATPLRAFRTRLEAMKSGDLQSSIEMQATPEVEWLAGAFNEALDSVNQYLLQGMTGAVITLSVDGTVIGASPAAEMILGYREDEIVGRRFSEVFSPAGSGRAQLTAIETAISQRQSVTIDEAIIATKDGRPVRIGVSVSYLRHMNRAGEGGPDEHTSADVVGVTIGFKDLTEIRRLREQLRKADQLVALGTLTTGVAHELRNPLASMRGLTELLGRDFGDHDPRRRYVATMLEAIDRLNVMVENLLLLSSGAPPGSDPVAVAHVVREVVSFVRMGLVERRVSMLVDVEPAAEVSETQASRSRLIQALSNIVLNAVQATPDDGLIEVGVMLADPNVIIRVHNTGSYIPPEVMKQLFVPFYTTKPTGTGLGLAIARQIVTASGGRIDVESEVAAGTTFTIELPLSGSAGAAAPPDQPESFPLTTTAHWA